MVDQPLDEDILFTDEEEEKIACDMNTETIDRLREERRRLAQRLESDEAFRESYIQKLQEARSAIPEEPYEEAPAPSTPEQKTIVIHKVENLHIHFT